MFCCEETPWQNFYKRKHNSGWLIGSEIESNRFGWGARQQAGRLGTVEFYIWICRQQSENHWVWIRVLKFQNPPPVIYFFQQGHNYFNKAIPPKPSVKSRYKLCINVRSFFQWFNSYFKKCFPLWYDPVLHKSEQYYS